ncbi:hypothetical protein KAOT1_12852 [Kordia algicida OT-1]|uniref:Uncharacterized protein n=1 Tax=Kordia algicida OT-1 TaxID=391587 RepID=A9DJI0_9FLAO|nr:hypothetical protein KAOT1_12852 [Kordia algicida OT-1]
MFHKIKNSLLAEFQNETSFFSLNYIDNLMNVARLKVLFYLKRKRVVQKKPLP